MKALYWQVGLCDDTTFCFFAEFDSLISMTPHPADDTITASPPLNRWAVLASVAEQQGDVMWHTARGLHTLIFLS